MSRPAAIHAWFESSTIDGASEHRIVLEDLPPVLGAARQTVHWRAMEVAGLELPPVVDSYVFGLALIAARADRDLVVHGAMSLHGLFNLGQLLAARHELMPWKFPRECELTPDRVVEIHRPPGAADGGIAALSGGLDSTYTVMRHALGTDGAASHKLGAMVMIHGFDAPFDRPDLFAAMRDRARPTIERVGLPLHTVRTDIRKLDNACWPESAIPLTANALAMFSNQYAFGVVSAGAPYDVLRMGLSHPPAFDALASNGWFTVITDGGACGRADKLEALAAYPRVIDCIKVCWEGSDPSRNCGVCKKCLLTRLNLLTAGIESDRCFDDSLDLSLIERLRWRNVYEARDFFTLCWNEMQRRGTKGPAVDALRRALRRVPAKGPDWGGFFGRLGGRVRRACGVGARAATANTPDLTLSSERAEG